MKERNCKTCKNWEPRGQAFDPSNNERYNAGVCTVEPRWLTTKESHYCGKFDRGVITEVPEHDETMEDLSEEHF
jgi:hypothetical protein